MCNILSAAVKETAVSTVCHIHILNLYGQNTWLYQASVKARGCSVERIWEVASGGGRGAHICGETLGLTGFVAMGQAVAV